MSGSTRLVEAVGKSRNRSTRARRAAAFLVILACGVFPLARGLAAEGSDVNGARRAELARIRERVESLRVRAAELESAEAGFETELERLGVELDMQRELVAEAVAERVLAEDAVTDSRAQVASIRLRMTALRDKLASRIVALYRASPVDWLRAFVSIRKPGDFFLYLRTLRFLAGRDARLLAFYRDQKTTLEFEQGRLEDHERTARLAADEERARLERLRGARRKQRLVLEALDRERSKLELKASALGDKERKLALLIAVLAGQQETPLLGTPIQDFRGVLDWPLEGRIATPFGPRQEARYGTLVPHNGIRITGQSGAAVKSVFAGAVIFAAAFEGFGLTTVVHHPERVFSLYAGLSSLQVQKGDVVDLGDVLGAVGGELYFEVRVENKPEDPSSWLR